MSKRVLHILALSLLALSVFPRLAHACECASIPWQKQVALSDAIFVGRVVEAQPLDYVVLEEPRQRFTITRPSRTVA
jgi:hypothetical protein